MCWLEQNEGFNQDLALDNPSGDLNPYTVNKVAGFIVRTPPLLNNLLISAETWTGLVYFIVRVFAVKR